MAKMERPTMKLSTSPRRFLFVSFLTLLFSMLSSIVVQANPFASLITNNLSTGNIEFWLNEGGGNVTVIYEDGTTNANFCPACGTPTGLNVPAGQQTFALGAHTSYQIICQKTGTGVPFQINSDADTYAIW